MDRSNSCFHEYKVDEAAGGGPRIDFGNARRGTQTISNALEESRLSEPIRIYHKIRNFSVLSVFLRPLSVALILAIPGHFPRVNYADNLRSEIESCSIIEKRRQRAGEDLGSVIPRLFE